MGSDTAAAKFNQVQGELEQLVIARQKLETQLQENKVVDEELKSLKDGAQVYKLNGGVLLPVELSEASSNVAKRLQFISAEIERCEDNIKNKQQQLETTRNELINRSA